MTKSHALEDKYNAEEDAKKIAEHEAEQAPTKTNLENYQTLQDGVCWLCLLKLKKRLKAELLLHKKH